MYHRGTQYYTVLIDRLRDLALQARLQCEDEAVAAMLFDITSGLDVLEQELWEAAQSYTRNE